MGTAMKDISGTLRTIIQGPGTGQNPAARAPPENSLLNYFFLKSFTLSL
jgi:hypothetical protein